MGCREEYWFFSIGMEYFVLACISHIWLMINNSQCFYLFLSGYPAIQWGQALKSPTIIILQLICGFISTICLIKLSALMFGTNSCLALCCYGKKKKTDQNQLSGRKGLFQLLLYRPSMMEASARTQGRSLASKHWSRSCGGVLLTGLFSIACSPHFLIPSRIQEEKEIEF